MARKLSEAARAKMIEATESIILELGVDGFTVDEVARRSGVAKTTLYRHFDTGDDLLLSTMDEMIEEFDTPDTGTFRGDLREIASKFIGITASPAIRQLFVSILNRAIANPDFAAHHAEVKKRRHQPMRVALQRGIARGEVDPDIDIELALHFMQGPFFAKRMMDDQDVSAADIEVFLTLVERALAPPDHR